MADRHAPGPGHLPDERRAPAVRTLTAVRRICVVGLLLAALALVTVPAPARAAGGLTALGLREQLFVIERKLDDAGRVTGFAFIGRGWGHGVGMCQVGAYGLARQGLSSEQILKAYYTGIELTRMY